MPKIKLSKTETAFLFGTKNVPHEKYNNEEYVWNSDSQERSLTGYDTIAFTFLEIYGLKQEFLFIENLNNVLIDILEKVKPGSAIKILQNIQRYNYVESTGYGTNPLLLSHSPAEAIFREVYGHLQAVQIREKLDENYVDIFDYDETYLKEEEK